MADTKSSCTAPDQCGGIQEWRVLQLSWSGFRTIRPSSSAARSHRQGPVASASSSTSCKPRWRSSTWSWGCCGRRWGWRRRRRGRGWRREGESGWLRTCWARPPGSQSWFWKYFWMGGENAVVGSAGYWWRTGMLQWPRQPGLGLVQTSVFHKDTFAKKSVLHSWIIHGYDSKHCAKCQKG